LRQVIEHIVEWHSAGTTKARFLGAVATQVWRERIRIQKRHDQVSEIQELFAP
jgi:hypothetical protein